MTISFLYFDNILLYQRYNLEYIHWLTVTSPGILIRLKKKKHNDYFRLLTFREPLQSGIFFGTLISDLRQMDLRCGTVGLRLPERRQNVTNTNVA